MLPCKNCAYRKNIPGNCHINCQYDWLNNPKDADATFKDHTVSARARQWFKFPFNYDPVWGPDLCSAHSETLDTTKLRPSNPLEDLLSLLG